jgi:MFS family permease
MRVSNAKAIRELDWKLIAAPTYHAGIQRAIQALGLWSAISAFGFAGGPLLGGLLVDMYGWRSSLLTLIFVSRGSSHDQYHV